MTATAGTTETSGAKRGTYDDLRRLMTLMTGDEKHDASATSTLDVLWVLYADILRVDPGRLDDPARDRFLLSKGHGPMAYYAVLAARGFLSEADLPGFGDFSSPLGHHPDRVLVPGAEIGSGSLGHGLGQAVGVALGLRLQRVGARTVVLIGDGELDEGSCWEAVQYAGRARLDGLTAVVVDNDSSSTGWPGGIEQRFVAEGWSGVTVDGRDHGALRSALGMMVGERPHVVVARVERRGA